MAVYTYVDNKDPSDRTGVVIFRNGMASLKRGEWLDITGSEFNILSQRINLVAGMVGGGGPGVDDPSSLFWISNSAASRAAADVTRAA